MAKNYTAYEAAAIVAEGLKKENAEEFQDIMRRFPFFGAVASKVNEEGLKLLECLPEYMTARKFNRYLKDLLGVEDIKEDDIDEVEEKPKKEKKEKKAKKAVEEDLDDDLDDDEEEEVKHKKKAKKEEKKVEKKKAKKVVEDDDDDDDFDFDDED